MKQVLLLELPFNLGLKEPAPGQEPGVKKLPEWLRRHQFHHLLSPVQTLTLPAPPYTGVRDQESGVLHADAIVDYAQQQAALLRDILSGENFPLVLGGDCSIMIGNALGLKQKGNYALFYLDGHTDFMEPPLSQTGGAGGMAAAMVAGLGPEKLTNIKGQAPYIREEYIWCVGNREYDEEYENVVRNSKATYISLAALRETGIANCARSFLDMVAEQDLDGFWLHIDVDVLDDELMPAVDSRSPDGLSYEEFNQLLYLLLSSPKATGLELTILDPDLDPGGEYTTAFVSNFVSTFQKARKNLS
jgi:arginase